MRSSVQERKALPGRSSSRVEEQPAQGADLLIPHAVAAKACAGEAADEDPSYRFYRSIGVLQQRNVDCRALTNRPYGARRWS